MSAGNEDGRLSIVILAEGDDVLRDATLASVAPLGGEYLVAEIGQPPQAGSSSQGAQEAVSPGLAAQVERVEHRWVDDFAACRNAAMRQAQGDWLLWLEAGEVVTPLALEHLAQALQRGLDPQCAYQLPIGGVVQQGLREQVYQLRLHPRRSDLRFVGRVRERLVASEDGAELDVQTLELPVVRTAAMRQPDVLQARAELHVRLAELDLAEQGESAGLHNELGDAYLSLGRVEASVRHFQRALALAGSGSSEQLEAYYGLLTCLDAVGPDRHAQLSLVLNALETFPLDAQLLVALGGYLRSLGYLPTAVRAFDVAFREGQVEPRLWHLPEIRELAAACGAGTYLAMDRPASALYLLEAAWRMAPSSRLLPRELAATYRRLGRLSEAERVEAVLRDEAARTAWDEPPAADRSDEGAAVPLVRVDPPGEVPLPVRPAAAQAVQRRFPTRPGI